MDKSAQSLKDTILSQCKYPPRLAYGKYTKTRCSNYYHKGERDSNFKYDYFLYIFQKENYGLTQYIGNYLIPTNMPDNKNNLTFKLVKNLN